MKKNFKKRLFESGKMCLIGGGWRDQRRQGRAHGGKKRQKEAKNNNKPPKSTPKVPGPGVATDLGPENPNWVKPRGGFWRVLVKRGRRRLIWREGEDGSPRRAFPCALCRRLPLPGGKRGGAEKRSEIGKTEENFPNYQGAGSSDRVPVRAPGVCIPKTKK